MIILNKTELIQKIAEQLNATSGDKKLSQKDIASVLDAALNAISLALKEGDDVSLKRFGEFRVTERAARNGRHPRTRETIEIPATKIPQFRPSQKLKDIVK